MRLIDADALKEVISTPLPGTGIVREAARATIDVVLNAIDREPTIPTTTTNNGVTSCAFCGGVVDIEYLEES